MQKLPSPKEFFGWEPGADRKMIRWDKLVEYYKLLAKESPRMIFEEMGPTTEGNPFIHLVISAEENIKNLETYKKISKQLADARGLSKEEITRLSQQGKAICMQSYSLHSNEVAGSQMCPRLVYDLLSAEDGDLMNILREVIFIMVPCSEPDGEIIFTDWYNKYLGTEFEGCGSPYLRHNYAGHSNNRDSLHATVVETRYLNELLIHRYMPQAYQDHHHECHMHDRMSISPQVNHLPDAISPLVYREQSLYGAYMANILDQTGHKGIVSGDEKYDGYPITSGYTMSQMHNITGMLTETADALIATPVYIHPDQLIGHAHVDRCIQCPSPWEGGWWHLSDMVDQQYWASLALLSYMAHNRENVLWNMAEKGLRQTQRGAESAEQAYIIPKKQHDPSAAHRLLTILYNHKVEMFVAGEDFTADGRFYDKGSVIVPLAQPKYAVVKTMLSACDITHNRYATNSRNSDSGDGFYSYFSENMGVSVFAANESVTVTKVPYVHTEWKDRTFPLPAAENDSYRVANLLMKKGVSLWRDENGDFHDAEGEGRQKIEPMRVGLLKTSCTGNEEEGFTRHLLDLYDFPSRIVMDREWWEKPLDDIDVLIIPGDPYPTLMSGDTAPKECPPEYHHGLATSGRNNLRKFVEEGGHLVAWTSTLPYITETFGLPFDNVSATGKVNFNGSTVRIKLAKDKLTQGMPKNTTAFFWRAPAVKVRLNAWSKTTSWQIPGYIESEKDMILSGMVTGKELVADTPCVFRIPYGRGEITFFTFDPKFRLQTDGTFKLLFNALYRQ